MKKLLLILLCMPLLFSCGSNEKYKEKEKDNETEKLRSLLYKTCKSVDDGTVPGNWDKYCDCFVEKAMEKGISMKEFESMTDDEGYKFGYSIGSECGESLME